MCQFKKRSIALPTEEIRTKDEKAFSRPVVDLVGIVVMLALPYWFLWGVDNHPACGRLVCGIESYLVKLVPCLKTFQGYHAALALMLGFLFTIPVVIFMNRHSQGSKPCSSEPVYTETARWKFSSIIMLIVALGLSGVAGWLARTRGASGSIVAIWVLGILSLLFAAWILDRGFTVRSPMRFDRRDALAIGIIFIFGLIYYSSDLNSWRYWDSGDDTGFFTYARNLDMSGINHPFALDGGVFGHHPVIASVAQRFLMMIAGSGPGFILSTVLAAILGACAFYLFLRELFGRLVSFCSAIFLLSSSLYRLMAHLGMNTNFGIFPMLMGSTLLLQAVRKRRYFPAAVGGVLIGLGFYLHISAVFGLLPVAIIPFTGNSARVKRQLILIFFLGVAVVLLPALLDNSGLLDPFFKQTIINSVKQDKIETYFGGRLSGNITHILWGCLFPMAAGYHLPESYQMRLHAGPILGPVTGGLFMLGFVGLFYDLRRHKLAWVVLIITGVIILGCGGLQFNDPVHVNRITLLLPVFVLLAAFGLQKLETWYSSGVSNKWTLFYIFSGFLLFFELAGSAYHLQITIPKKYQHYSYINFAAYVLQSTETDKNVYWSVPWVSGKVELRAKTKKAVKGVFWTLMKAGVKKSSDNFLKDHTEIRGGGHRMHQLTMENLHESPLASGYLIVNFRSQSQVRLREELIRQGYSVTLQPKLKLAASDRWQAFYVTTGKSDGSLLENRSAKKRPDLYFRPINQSRHRFSKLLISSSIIAKT